MPKYLTMLEGNEPEMLDASPRPSQRRQLPPVARRQQPAAKNGIRSTRIVYGCPCSGGVSALLVGQEVDELGFLGIENFGRKAWNVTKDIGHATAEVGRSTAPILGTLVGTAAGAAFGTNTGGAAAGGGSLSSMLPGVMDMFGFGPSGGGGSAPQAAGQPQQQQQTGIDPRLLYIGGGALLLVLLVRK